MISRGSRIHFKEAYHDAIGDSGPISILGFKKVSTANWQSVAHHAFLMLTDPNLTMKISCADVFLLWRGMMAVYGACEMAHRNDFQHEHIRELLMKLSPIWSDNAQQLQAVVDTVQILTVMMGMVFKSQMDGGIPGEYETKDFLMSTWIEGRAVFNVPQPTTPQSLRTKLANYTKRDDLKMMLVEDLKQARIDVNTFIQQCEPIPELAHLGARFHYIDTLLDDVQNVVRNM